ncbi:PqqD family protein [Corallococcus sp. H22C18031201]|uniref:PqqD family protein n=1 Tax=Citreicoccus inhibens TaxID=2849499 RepID=UPI000E748B19|nr:PqqD family protein [Citreicoccus inhibens]MBU8894791.1 PqqD family protein [Citreicoccus inhibens]RJS17735.1 PqqD family protein [Corallococcus sp. H22C18031201]
MSFPEDGIPRHRAGTDGKPFGADYLLLDAEGRTLRGLNATAARIWELCDGSRSARELAQQLVREVDTARGPGLPLEAVLRDTLGFLSELVRLGLIEDGRAGSKPAREE